MSNKKSFHLISKNEKISFSWTTIIVKIGDKMSVYFLSSKWNTICYLDKDFLFDQMYINITWILWMKRSLQVSFVMIHLCFKDYFC